VNSSELNAEIQNFQAKAIRRPFISSDVRLHLQTVACETIQYTV